MRSALSKGLAIFSSAGLIAGFSLVAIAPIAGAGNLFNDEHLRDCFAKAADVSPASLTAAGVAVLRRLQH